MNPGAGLNDPLPQYDDILEIGLSAQPRFFDNENLGPILVDKTNRRGSIGRCDGTKIFLVSLDIRLQRLQESLDVGRAENQPRYELSHRTIGIDKSEIKDEFFLGMPDSGQI